MNKLAKIFLAGSAVLAIAVVSRAMVGRYNAYLVDEPGLAYVSTYTLNLNNLGIDQLSFTSKITTVTFTAQTFTGGQLSTGTITISSQTLLNATSSYDYLYFLTDVSSSPISSASVIKVNGFPLYEGANWFFDGTSTAATVNSIMAAINKYVPSVVASTAISSGYYTVFTTAANSGSYGNNMTFTSNIDTNTMVISSSSFLGGRDNASFGINQMTFMQGNQWTNVYYSTSGSPGVGQGPVYNSSATLASMVAACNASSATTGVVCSSNTLQTVIWASATAVGPNYAMFSSSQSQLTLAASTLTITGNASSGTMTGGYYASYNLNFGTGVTIGSTTIINIASHGFTTGLPVYVTTLSATQTQISGLPAPTTYYAIKINDNSISFATTSSLAVQGYPVVLTSSSSKTTQEILSATPLKISTASFPVGYKWEVSNDGQNWMSYSSTTYGVSVTSQTVTTYVSTGAVNSGDFGPINYGFLRLIFQAPTAGAVKAQISINGKTTNQ